MRSTTVAIACATLCAAWCASAAHADIVHFVNPAPGQPGHYDWRWAPVQGWESWLDITASASSQSGLASGNSVGQLYDADPPDEGSSIYNRNGWGAWVGCARHFAFGFTSNGYQSGSLIGFTTLWYLPAAPHMTDFGDDGSYFTTIPEGSRSYLGVITATGNRGWIEVERTGMTLAAFSWAYETQPGVPIVAGQIPSPGAAVLLALASLTTRRRRS